MVESVMTTASMILMGACSFQSIHLSRGGAVGNGHLRRCCESCHPTTFQLTRAPDAALLHQRREPPTGVVGRYGFDAIRSSHLWVAARCMCHRRNRHDAHRH